MRIKKFQAENMAEAMKMVREEMGDDALILSSKKQQHAGGGIEVVAAMDDAIAAAQPSHTHGSKAESGIAAERAHGRTNYATRMYRRNQGIPEASEPEQQATPPPQPAWHESLEHIAAQEMQHEHMERRRLIPQMQHALRLAGVHDAVIEKITSDAQLRMSRRLADSGAALRDLLAGSLQKFIYTPVHGSIRKARPTIRVFIGPTGVGKTTSMAKIAARGKIDAHEQTGLITIDTYRIGAIDQLRTFAHIAEMPLKVAYVLDEFAAALHAFRSMDAILVDTTGRNPRDFGFMEELREYLELAMPSEVNLVLSATTRYAELADIIEEYNKVGFNRVLLTKIDEVRHPAVLLNLANLTTAPLSFVANGQNIPDDLIEADKRHLAELILEEWNLESWIS